MMPHGFKPVGWVAAVGSAALGCYMLSLNVASERAELRKIEHRIMVARSDIRTLQTELGTRGRLQQLEHWNAEVLALSAPTSHQFVQNELMLARFETREKSIDDQAKVQMASATTTTGPAQAPQVKAAPARKLSPADYAAAADRAHAQPQSQPMLRLASADRDDKPRLIKAAAQSGAEGEKKAEPAKKATAAKPETKLASLDETKKPASDSQTKKADRAEPTAKIVKKAESKTADKADTGAKPAKKASVKTAEAKGEPATPASKKASGGAGGQ